MSANWDKVLSNHGEPFELGSFNWEHYLFGSVFLGRVPLPLNRGFVRTWHMSKIEICGEYCVGLGLGLGGLEGLGVRS